MTNDLFSVPRARAVVICLLAAFAALAGRVAYLQTYGRQQTLSRAERQQHQTQIIPHRRGCIFDCNGMELAGTVQTPTLFIDPKFMQDQFQQDGRSLIEMDRLVTKLAKVIDKDPFELSQLLGDKATSRYVKVVDHLDDATCAEIRKLDLPGVGLEPASVRNYPMGSIAAHILGGTGADGRGLEGLELAYEKTLSGKDGFERTLKDARHRPLKTAAFDYVPPKHGQHVMLTIDANVQMITEQELASTCKEFKAKRGEAVVMNPKTGEVLALANWPTFNPQNLEDSSQDLRRNRALTDPYEPGSTIKPFIVGPALQWRTTRVNEVWKMGGPYKSSLRRKPVTDVHSYPELATWDVLVKSSNVGMTMLGERLGKQKVFTALGKFHFGEPTGIELLGEDGGLLRPYTKWADSDVVSSVQGYSVMVTPLQLARAFCAYANGGRLVKPTLVRGVLDADGRLVSKNKPDRLEMMPEVLDPITAAEMKRILCDVVIRGTAKGARSDTWNIFGKTGTAHISGGRAGYNDERYTSSFISGAPAEDPQIVVAFIIHEPDASTPEAKAKKQYYGGAVAAPGASRLIERVLTYMNVPASPDLPVPPPQIASVLYDYNPKVYARKTPKVQAVAASASVRD